MSCHDWDDYDDVRGGREGETNRQDHHQFHCLPAPTDYVGGSSSSAAHDGKGPLSLLLLTNAVRE